MPFIRSRSQSYYFRAKKPTTAHAKLATIPYSISFTLLSF